MQPRWADLDPNQHVNNVRYIGWILEVKTLLLLSPSRWCSVYVYAHYFDDWILEINKMVFAMYINIYCSANFDSE